MAGHVNHVRWNGALWRVAGKIKLPNVLRVREGRGRIRAAELGGGGGETGTPRTVPFSVTLKVSTKNGLLSQVAVANVGVPPAWRARPALV